MSVDVSGFAHAHFGAAICLLFTLWKYSSLYLAINVLVLNYLFRRRLQCQME